MEAFEVKKVEKADVVIFEITGYFGDDAGKEVRNQILELLKKGMLNFILDFTGSSVINSLGIAQLFDLTLKITEDNQGKVIFAGMNPLMQEVVGMAGIGNFAESVSDVPSALLKLGSGE